MKKLILALCLFAFSASAQEVMTPEKLWNLGRVSAVGVSLDGESLIYRVTHYNIDSNSRSSVYYSMPVAGGTPTEVADISGLIANSKISTDGTRKVYHKKVKVKKVAGTDYYPEMEKSEVQIYDDLMYRHWDTWADGSVDHVFVSNIDGSNETDIMEGMPFVTPTMPFGDDSDYIWHPEANKILYVTKTKVGADYAVSTNTDIFEYDVTTKKTINLTDGMMGYDNSPSFSTGAVLAWLSMKRDGYESDKNDIIVKGKFGVKNLTQQWDGTVLSYRWSDDGKKIYFVAPVGGTKQLFEVDNPGKSKKQPVVSQITSGQFDVTGIAAQVGKQMIVSRTDMNHASELYSVNLSDGSMTQLTHVNDAFYNSIALSKVEKRMVKTTDNKDMVTWVIYPPNFDPNKKYPAILYCQGGPQGALSQFYSYRWNFQLMAANGYIVVAPNRRGMPGHGVEWNEQISKDYGGQNMEDYLAAIDDIAKEDYVDNDRLGAVGASYGGYSVFYLAGNHDGRFKSFISHDGIFNWRSMYGTTEELFFVNWDLGGNYWDTSNTAAQKSYSKFNPINYVVKWDTPILIVQGGKDYRVPIGQGLEAFQAAQLKGLKSKLLYLPNENHWVLSAQNGIIWQREFFKWLKETL